MTPETTVEPERPAVPAHLRTLAYFVGLAAGALVLLTSGLAPIWLDPDTAGRVVDTAAVVSGAAAFVAGGLGVAYRPTR